MPAHLTRLKKMEKKMNEKNNNLTVINMEIGESQEDALQKHNEKGGEVTDNLVFVCTGVPSIKKDISSQGSE